MDDGELIAATARGDAEAFEVFYRRHLPRVVGFALRATGDSEVAAVPLPATACGSNGPGCLQPATVVWYGTSLQRVVARFTFRRAAAITTPPFVLRGPAARPTRDMLSARGIAEIHFGQPRAAVVAALDRLLGVPHGPYVPGGLCNFDHTITWRDQRSPAGASSLIGHFAQGRLVGYEYGKGGNHIARRRSVHGPFLATTRGLTVGDTLERGRRLYGSAFKASTAQGGSWSVATPTGSIDGYASDVPRPGNLNAVKVLTIAGSVGCPAESP